MFKRNTVGCYTPGLGQAIEVNGDWVVGLFQISYPHTWYNLKAYHAYFELDKTTYDDPHHQNNNSCLSSLSKASSSSL